MKNECNSFILNSGVSSVSEKSTSVLHAIQNK